MRSASGFFPAITRATSSAAPASSGAGTTWLTEPCRYSSAAVMRRPVNIISRALNGPTRRCMCRPPPRTPTSISGSANTALSDAITMSQDATSASPAPTAAPLTAAITGRVPPEIEKKQSRTTSPASTRLATLSPGSSSRRAYRRADSLMSAPAQKTRSPSAVKIATAASVPCDSDVNTRAISRIMGALSAFTGGRRSVTVATRSVTSTWVNSRLSITAQRSPLRSGGWVLSRQSRMSYITSIC